MTISIISALAKNKVIGKTNALPWYLPADLRHFRKKTTGKTIVMGFNTFESVGEKHFLNRKNIVLISNPDYQAPPNCFLARSIPEVLEIAKDDGELMVCGGASVYQQFLPMADKLYLTFIDHAFDGDVFFPEFDMADWREISREDHEPDEKNKYPYSFVVLERIKKAR